MSTTSSFSIDKLNAYTTLNEISHIFDLPSRVNFIISLKSETPDAVKFTVRLLFLFSGLFYSPMEQDWDQMQRNLSKPEFMLWLYKFMDLNAHVPFHNVEQLSLASNFIYLRENDFATLRETNVLIHFILLRMQMLLFFSSQKKQD